VLTALTGNRITTLEQQRTTILKTIRL